MKHVAVLLISMVAISSFQQFASAQAAQRESRIKVSVSAHVEKFSNDLLTVNVVVKNVYSNSIYVAANPIRSDGTLGPYLSVSPEDFYRFIVLMRFYPLPKFQVFKYNAG